MVRYVCFRKENIQSARIDFAAKGRKDFVDTWQTGCCSFAGLPASEAAPLTLLPPVSFLQVSSLPKPAEKQVLDLLC